MLRLCVSPDAPDANLIARAAAVVKAGGLVALPTDTLYGLAVNPFDVAAVGRVFLVKGRSGENGLPLVASDVEQVRAALGPLPAQAVALTEAFWPGPLTLLLPAPAALPKRVTGGTALVGVRVPRHDVPRRLCEACGSLLTATSANRTGQQPSNDPELVAAALGGDIDVLIDAGKSPGGPPSTIVEVGGSEPRLVRDGAIAWERILECLK
jgi:L-threonylcarbamoyladenylate synthase